MGRYVGRVIAARAAGRAAPRPFRYRHYGDLATIGRKAAVVRLDKIHLTGFVGWLFWSVAHVYFLIGVRNRLAVAFSWLWNYLTYQRGARLITDDVFSPAERGASTAPAPTAAARPPAEARGSAIGPPLT
jgi:NADH:ubiquinone reductase (H+-translocating)